MSLPQEVSSQAQELAKKLGMNPLEDVRQLRSILTVTAARSA